MNYEEFCAALQEELFNMLDTGYSIHREHILKNNGVVLDSLALLKAGKHCSPVISLEMLYEQFEKGHSMSELCDYMVSITDTELPLSVAGLTSLNHFEDFRDRITCRLVAQDKNEELLKTIGHRIRRGNSDQLRHHKRGVRVLELDAGRSFFACSGKYSPNLSGKFPAP